MLKQCHTDWSQIGPQGELTFVNMKIVNRKVMDLLNLFFFSLKKRTAKTYICSDVDTSYEKKAVSNWIRKQLIMDRQIPDLQLRLSFS